MSGEGERPLTYEDALDALSRALVFGIDPSLDGIVALAQELGNPQNTYRCIQIAGTNGKSSTARMAAALLHAEGFKVGLYTSPELVEYPERFEIDGRVTSHKQFASIVDAALCAGRKVAQRVQDAAALKDKHIRHDGAYAPSCEPGLPQVTEFELLTAAALELFGRERVDFAVLEVGMGGRWDATSVVDPTVSCITGIGLDHIHVLGDTLEQIASEKAAIIKPDTRVVLGPGTAPVRQVFYEQCNRNGIQPCVVCEEGQTLFPEIQESSICSYRIGETSPRLVMDIHASLATYRGIKLDAPVYQIPNVACAVAIVEAALQRPLDSNAINRACEAVTFPGRFETLLVDPPFIIDAAHNPQGAQVVAKAITDRFGDVRPQLLLAVLADKDACGIIDALKGVVGEIIVTQTDSKRAIPATELADLVRRRTGHMPQVIASLPDAVRHLAKHRDGPVVATGSITLAGQVKGLVLNTHIR